MSYWVRCTHVKYIEILHTIDLLKWNILFLAYFVKIVKCETIMKDKLMLMFEKTMSTCAGCFHFLQMSVPKLCFFIKNNLWFLI